MIDFFLNWGTGLEQTLLRHVVQVTIVALIVWPLTSFVAQKNAHVAHLLWALVLIKCITPPLIAAPTSPFCWFGDGQAMVEIELKQASLGAAKVAVNTLTAIERPIDEQAIVAPIEVHQNAATRSDRPEDAIAAVQMTPLMSKNVLTDLSFSGVLTLCLVCIWVCGVAVTLLIAVWRMILLQIEIGQSKSSKAIQQLAESLQEKLGVRRRVRVRVLASAFGPAVIGFVRPTILLPQSIIDVIDVGELEPVIAHELIHFRRGDLWWAVLESVCLCLFWFHPLVRLAVRQLTVESERCCDEQTIAGLQCSPGHYAKGLLSVLECKVRLQAIPGLPGVRTVDITSKRLERIMNFKDEMKKRTPLLAWLVFVISGLVALPGAAWVVEQDSVPEKQVAPRLLADIHEPLKVTERRGIVPPMGYVVVTDGQVTSGNLPIVIRAYEIASLKKRFAADMLAEGCSRTKLELVDLQIFPGGSAPAQEQKTEAIFNGQAPEGLPEKVKLGGDEPIAKILGDFLFLLWPESMQDDMRQRLDIVRESGFRQIQYRASIARVSKKTLEEQKFKWSLLGADNESAKVITVPAETTTNQGKVWPTVVLPLAGNVHATGTQNYAPVYVAEVKRERLEQLKGTLNQQRKMSTGTTFSGCRAPLEHGITQRPFVVSVKRKEGEDEAFDPVIKLFEVGTKVTVHGKHNVDDSIDLTCKLSHSSIVDVGVQEGLLGDGVQVQVPKLDTLDIDIEYRLPHGSGLVVATPIESTSDRFRVLLLDCEALTLKNEPSHPQPVRTVSYESDVNPFDQPTTPKLTKLTISCAKGDQEPATNSWAIKAILKEMGFAAEVTGHLAVNLKPNTVEVSGKGIDIEFAHQKFSADTGTLTFTNKKLSSLSLVGGVEYCVGGLPSCTLYADNALLVRGTEEPDFSNVFSSVKMFGNVGVSEIEGEEGMTLSADELELKSNGSIFLKGNARLEMNYHGVRQSYIGDCVNMNDETEHFEISGKGEMTIQKEALKETWKGEEIRHSMYGLGITVDGEAQDFDVSPFLPDAD